MVFVKEKETKEIKFALLYKTTRLFDVEQLLMSKSIPNMLFDLCFAMFLVIVYVSCAAHMFAYHTEVLGFSLTCSFTEVLQLLLAL